MNRAALVQQACWSRDDVLCLQNTATKPSLDGDVHRGKHVFDALHTPPPMSRHADVRAFANGATTAPDAKQDDLLQAIDGGVGRTKTLLFIGGATGAGKSHMARWAHAQYEQANPAAVCIHIEREDTDLPTVVMRLSEAFDDDEQLAAIAREAKRVEPGDTDQALDGRIVHALSAYATAVARESSNYMNRFLSPAQKELLRQAGREVPPDPTPPTHIDVVRTDPELNFVRLWAEFVRTGPAERALAGREGLLRKFREADPDKRIILGEDLTPLASVHDDLLAPNLRPLRDRLGEAGFRDWIADLLLGNRALDFAVDDVGVGIRAEALRTALRDALKKVDHERVVFFFEDWGTVTGVRSGLLEAFLTMQDKFTAVIADTTDEIRKIQDNVADRTIAVFELEPLPEQAAVAMAGRALNSVRVGGVELLAHATGNQPVPNACAPCGFSDVCHEAFGSVNIDGLGAVGLYPLTEPVIERAMGGQGSAKTPRTLLMNVVRPALEVNETVFERGDYPTAEVLEKLQKATLPLDAARRGEAARSLPDASTHDASVRVLELYRLQPALRSLPPQLARAFGVADFGSADDVTTDDTTDDTDDTAHVPAPPKRRELPDLAVEAERFARGEGLAQNTRLRDRLADFVLAGVEFGTGVGPRKTMDEYGVMGAPDIKLEGAKSGEGLITIRREDAEAVKALVWAASTAPQGDFRQQDSAHSRRARALNILALWRKVADDHTRDPERRRGVAKALLSYLVAANALFDLGARQPTTPSGVINAALRQPTSARDLSRDERVAYDRREAARQRLLAEISFYQGDTGGATGLDIPLILPILKEFLAASEEWTLAPVDEVPEDLRKWAEAVAAAFDDLRREVDSADFRLPEKMPTDGELQALRPALVAARQAAAEARVTDATLQAINRAMEAVEAAQSAPKVPDTSTVGTSLLSLPRAMQVCREFERAVEPRKLARLRIDEVLSRRNQALAEVVDYTVLARFIEAIEGLAGVKLPRPSSDFESPGDQKEGRSSDLLGRVQALVSSLSGDVKRQATAEALADAEESASELVRALQENVAERERAARLGVACSNAPEFPTCDEDVVGYLNSRRLRDWTVRLTRATQDISSQLRRWWEDRLREVEPRDMWELARQLGDEEAVEAFHHATNLYHDAKRQAFVPLEAEKSLQEIRDAEDHAWKLLRRQQGDVLDLALKIHESGGELVVSSDVAERLKSLNLYASPIEFVISVR